MKLFLHWKVLLIGLLLVGIALFITYPLLFVSEATQAENERWQAVLTEEQYEIMRLGGTEQPYSSPLLHEERAGTYYDATGTQALFRSEDKYDSGTGWPSFTKPISEDVVIEQLDLSIGIPRTEVLSSKHGHHIGHVFTDGPEPTGLRYCMNGVALKFVPDVSEVQ